MNKAFWRLACGAAIACAALGCSGSASKSASDGAVAITVTEDGFMPNEIHVKAGQPVTLAVTRKTDKTCATELVLADYNINQKLPINETVRIQFTPKQAGRLTYACGMDMYKGHIVVE